MHKIQIAAIIDTSPNHIVGPVVIVSSQVMRNIDVVMAIPVRTGIASEIREFLNYFFGPLSFDSIVLSSLGIIKIFGRSDERYATDHRATFPPAQGSLIRSE